MKVDIVFYININIIFFIYIYIDIDTIIFSDFIFFHLCI